MRRVSMVLALLTLPAIAVAEIYQWVDESGQVGYADDLGSVPAKYRKNAKPLGGEEKAVEIIDKGEVGKEPRKENEKAQPAAVSGEEKTKPKAKPLYDGKDGETWKRDLARQKHEVKSLEDQSAGIRERMANPGKITRGEYLSLQNTARDLDVRISAARKKLQSMLDAADQAEVPAEYR